MAHKYKDPYSGKIKSNQYFRKQITKEKLQTLYSIGGDRWYPWPVGWNNHENPRLKRNYRRKISKYLKTQGHRKARKNEVTNYTYNKISEYWWNLD